LKLASWS